MAIADDLRAGAIDFGQVGANAPGWLAYSYSMVLPARRLVALGEADYPQALAIYLRMPERRLANGFTSTQWLIGKLADESAFDLCVQDPDLRMLMTIYVGASSDHYLGLNTFHEYDKEVGPVGARGWLQALDAAQTRRYAELRRLATRTDVTARQRADAYWRAACIIQAHGRELLFCSFGLDKSQPDAGRPSHRSPDPGRLEYPNGWHLYLDYFLPSLRLGRRPNGFVLDLAAPCADETRRLKAWYAQHIEHPTYSERMPRYEVLRLGLLAAKELPDNDPAGAVILQYIGNLLKYVDPPAATPAYRLLVNRFGQTPLGATATKNRWFAKDRPKLDEDLLR